MNAWDFIDQNNLMGEIESIYSEFYWSGELYKAPTYSENMVEAEARKQNIKLFWDKSVDSVCANLFELGLS